MIMVVTGTTYGGTFTLLEVQNLEADGPAHLGEVDGPKWRIEGLSALLQPSSATKAILAYLKYFILKCLE